MGRSALFSVLFAAMFVAAGCIGKEDAASPAAASGTRTDVDGAAASGGNATAPSNGTAPGSNTTASGNKTSSAGGPAEPGNCMRGMSMPGCTEAQAEAYFNERAANAPPPDKPLPPVTIALSAQGGDQTGAFALDNGTMMLLVEIVITDTGEGPYAALGPGGKGELSLDFVGPTKTTSVALGGPYVGLDAANALVKKSMTTLPMPASGAWSLVLYGQGAHAQVEISLIERFSM